MSKTTTTTAEATALIDLARGRSQKLHGASPAIQSLVSGLLASSELRDMSEREQRRAADERRLLVRKHSELLQAAIDAENSEKAAKKCSAAVRAVELAELALQTARQDLVETRAEADAAPYRLRGEASAIARELREAMDSRLADFRYALGIVSSALVFANRPIEHREERWFGMFKRLTIVMNTDEVGAANAVVRAQHDASFDLSLAGLTFREITAQLNAWCDELKAVLKDLNVEAPTIDADTSEVKDPRFFQPQEKA